MSDRQPAAHQFESIEAVEARFAEQGYVTDRMLATTVYLAVSLGKPVFLEGEPGVGKTEVAKVIAGTLNTELIRLQCYEGLDTAHALYEWNYPRQLLELRLQEARGLNQEEIGRNLFSEAFLLKRPLLQAIQNDGQQPPVLLIDEIDRSDEEFEAFLLEVLSDFQITIPEIGTLEARCRPVVVLTSNRTRELHDALKRRCLYHWIDYPSFSKEVQIITTRVPGIEPRLSAQICRFMELLRDQDFYKRPGIAETIDWASALLSLKVTDLDHKSAEATLGCILKYKGDIEKLRELGIEELVQQARVVSNYEVASSGT
ncbi:MAG: MoxR family ATPase [Candidatus Thiodiazotropha sp. (ex Lucinoma annulata)]|nr:MoxR family ATPase [Candidatus Thiodiazotropha sp. (ex Lucinoma borealis)]MCU7840063.1 MoxR family ATPase [Candidatus Thiodiazotropha sp. (ex Troendleina suluensis)]MCU7882581.1 MoxR family ATPase [Candidatus Thiodiazotropha sp. (ex Lucinoma annulata)]MCU7946308.1 MoxR family ATPase [Candidatus Thiodiazotropha sp. (ex Cardiolucina cf. quadrata)]MCU7854904.1 MoxR family ATPase [Candidatus Thiodiazotropha sp. (ex Lucinoma borealis)]